MFKTRALMALSALGCTVLLSPSCYSAPAQQSVKVEPLAPVVVQVAMVSDTAEAGTAESLEVVDVYAGWETWSEDPIHPECFSDEDCGIDRTGSPTRCIKRRDAIEEDVGRCRPQWLNRGQQRVQRRNQRQIIDAICKPPAWWYELQETGKDPLRQCWRFKGTSKALKQCRSRNWCDPERLHRFLRIPAKRESTWNHRTDHRLNQDLLANMGSYRRQYRRGTYAENLYFIDGITLGKSGHAVFGERNLRTRCWATADQLILDGAPLREKHNPKDRNCNGVPDRWERGYGWYGLNASNFTYEWDPQAPPEILARRVPATLAVLRKARYAWRKLSKGIDCKDAEGNPWTRKNPRPRAKDATTKAEIVQIRADWERDTWQTPTWWLIHRAVWGGDVCPQTGDPFYEKRFNARASKVELRPDEEITLQMLGTPVSRETQWDFVRKLEPKFEAVFPR